jgi:hypothetical protein
MKNRFSRRQIVSGVGVGLAATGVRPTNADYDQIFAAIAGPNQ